MASRRMSAALAGSSVSPAVRSARSRNRAWSWVNVEGEYSLSMRPAAVPSSLASRSTSSRVSRTRLLATSASPTTIPRSAMSVATTRNPWALA